jgi:hypothetical protein
MKNSPPSDPPDFPAPSGAGEILLYQSADGKTHQNCRFKTNTIWLTSKSTTCKEYLQVQQERAPQLKINPKKSFVFLCPMSLRSVVFFCG